MIAGWITTKWPVQGLASAALATYGVEWIEAAAQQGDISKLADSLRNDAPESFAAITQAQLEAWLKDLIAAFTKTAQEARR